MTKTRTDHPRVALFADSYGQVNGAAMTLARLVDFAETKGREMLCFYGGTETAERSRGSVKELSYRQSPLSIKMDDGLAFDPLFLRYFRSIMRELRDFRPDIIHITGLNDVSIAGCIASRFLNVPVIATWHTNIHEFGSRRVKRLLSFLPERTSNSIASFSERHILSGMLLYHKIPRMTLAPNPDLVSMIEQRTGRIAGLMTRGVDTEKFDPAKRTVNDGIFRFGYVGRLRPEKNVRLLIDVAKAIPPERQKDVRFLIVGDGSEYGVLKDSIPNADFTRFINGEALSEAYANMDVFLFPSETDTFGNVIQEANASGVPAVVMAKGGPMFIVKEGVNGMAARSETDFIDHSISLLDNPALLNEMRSSSRRTAEGNSWDAVFDTVYIAYSDCITMPRSSAGAANAERLNVDKNIQDAGHYVN